MAERLGWLQEVDRPTAGPFALLHGFDVRQQPFPQRVALFRGPVEHALGCGLQRQPRGVGVPKEELKNGVVDSMPWGRPEPEVDLGHVEVELRLMKEHPALIAPDVPQPGLGVLLTTVIAFGVAPGKELGAPARLPDCN